MIFHDMGFTAQFQKLCQIETRRLILVMGVIFAAVLVFQSSSLPYGNVLSSLFSVKSTMVGELPPLHDSKSANSSVVLAMSNNTEGLDRRKEKNEQENETKRKDIHPDENVVVLDKNSTLENVGFPDNSSSLEKRREPEEGFLLEKNRNSDNEDMGLKSEMVGSTKTNLTSQPIALAPVVDSANLTWLGELEAKEDMGLKPETVGSTKTNLTSQALALAPIADSTNLTLLSEVDANEDMRLKLETVGSTKTNLTSQPLALAPIVDSTNLTLLSELDANSSNTDMSMNSKISPDGNQTTETLSKGEHSVLLQSGLVTSNNNSTITSIPITKKKGRMQLQPTSISEMSGLLRQSRVSSRSMRPRWSSVRDQELLSVKSQIENAPILKTDPELYATIFRNISMFKRSYELMEHLFKVYIYKEGEKPIFHQPILKGIYASEGWFMKLLEKNQHFVVKDPQKAHLFYLPFSSKILRWTFYSLKQKQLSEYLNNYVDMIAAKYDFWNRTGGADHFLAACHDWAPRETSYHMGNCIRALCNADVSKGFKIGKDVSLPVTYVRMEEKPLKGIGGKPPSKRPILAFFAGSMHGYLRPILLQYWENKDPSMKIFGPLPRDHVDGKMNYVQYMKNSKYCICARGYEVHTPRVVEAIFYECVPVIISDNYVPPFFEVLDWEAFSVFVPEKDVPNLKNILLSIPKKKYLMLQMRVKKVQQHFLWHTKPVKYDIFHMTLHSIWYNRVFQINPDKDVV